MRLSEYAALDAVGLAALITNGEVTATEAAALAAAAVATVNPHLNAVIELYDDRIDRAPSYSLGAGPLYGVPILNKDLSFAEAGRRHEMGSLFARGQVPTRDCTAVERLRQAGLNMIGRTTTPEFGNAGITESTIAGVTRNPWDTARTPGGSSGGSAAIVAAGAVPVATAGDGGGSTRTPASLCGLVGLKTTRGKVPVGPARGEATCGMSGTFVVTRSMRDCATFLDILGGPSPGDPYVTAMPPEPYAATLDKPLPPLRIAFTAENWAGVPVSTESRQALHSALGLLEETGHSLEEASPVLDWEALFAATVTIMCANLANGVDKLSATFGRSPLPRELQSSTWACYRQGKTLAAGDLLGSLEVFNTVSRSVGAFFEQYDVLMTPACVYPAPLIEESYRCDPKEPITGTAYQENVYANDLFACLFNTTGQPAITLPLHETQDPLPLGVQVAGRFGDEETLLRLGRFFEVAAPWKDRAPPIHIAKLAA